MKNNIALLCFLLFLLIFSSCREDVEIQDALKVEIESIEKSGNSVFVKSRVNMLSNQISDHGHYWSNGPEFTPDSDEVQYTCHGPLINSEEFTDQILLDEGIFYIGSYVIVNEYLIYNEPYEIKILLN